MEDELARARHIEKAIHMEEKVISADDRSVRGILVDENAQERYPAGRGERKFMESISFRRI